MIIIIITTENLRVMLYLVGIFRTSNLRNSISGDPERCFPWSGVARGGCVKESGYMKLCNMGKTTSLNIKRLLIKEKQISQIKEFSAFLYMGKCKSLGLLKLLLSYAS